MPSSDRIRAESLIFTLFHNLTIGPLSSYVKKRLACISVEEDPSFYTLASVLLEVLYIITIIHVSFNVYYSKNKTNASIVWLALFLAVGFEWPKLLQKS